MKNTENNSETIGKIQKKEVKDMIILEENSEKIGKILKKL
jgi:hypothetical protein